MAMTDNRPYIVRAIYKWIVDNDCTPYILVDSHWPNATLPPQFYEEEKIVLNISPMATRELEISNEIITFLTRFDGEVFTISIPVDGVLAVYAQENGQGMVFDPKPHPEEGNDETFKVDKPSNFKAKPSVSITNATSGQGEFGKESSTKNSRPKGKPSLKIIK